MPIPKFGEWEVENSEDLTYGTDYDHYTAKFQSVRERRNAITPTPPSNDSTETPGVAAVGQPDSGARLGRQIPLDPLPHHRSRERHGSSLDYRRAKYKKDSTPSLSGEAPSGSDEDSSQLFGPLHSRRVLRVNHKKGLVIRDGEEEAEDEEGAEDYVMSKQLAVCGELKGLRVSHLAADTNGRMDGVKSSHNPVHEAVAISEMKYRDAPEPKRQLPLQRVSRCQTGGGSKDAMSPGLRVLRGFTRAESLQLPATRSLKAMRVSDRQADASARSQGLPLKGSRKSGLASLGFNGSKSASSAAASASQADEDLHQLSRAYADQGSPAINSVPEVDGIVSHGVKKGVPHWDFVREAGLDAGDLSILDKASDKLTSELVSEKEKGLFGLEEASGSCGNSDRVVITGSSPSSTQYLSRESSNDDASSGFSGSAAKQPASCSASRGVEVEDLDPAKEPKRDGQKWRNSADVVVQGTDAGLLDGAVAKVTQAKNRSLALSKNSRTFSAPQPAQAKAVDEALSLRRPSRFGRLAGSIGVGKGTDADEDHWDVSCFPPKYKPSMHPVNGDEGQLGGGQMLPHSGPVAGKPSISGNGMGLGGPGTLGGASRKWGAGRHGAPLLRSSSQTDRVASGKTSPSSGSPSVAAPKRNAGRGQVRPGSFLFGIVVPGIGSAASSPGRESNGGGRKLSSVPSSPSKRKKAARTASMPTSPSGAAHGFEKSSSLAGRRDERPAKPKKASANPGMASDTVAKKKSSKKASKATEVPAPGTVASTGAESAAVAATVPAITARTAKVAAAAVGGDIIKEPKDGVSASSLASKGKLGSVKDAGNEVHHKSKRNGFGAELLQPRAQPAGDVGTTKAARRSPWDIFGFLKQPAKGQKQSPDSFPKSVPQEQLKKPGTGAKHKKGEGGLRKPKSAPAGPAGDSKKSKRKGTGKSASKKGAVGVGEGDVKTTQNKMQVK